MVPSTALQPLQPAPAEQPPNLHQGQASSTCLHTARALLQAMQRVTQNHTENCIPISTMVKGWPSPGLSEHTPQRDVSHTGREWKELLTTYWRYPPDTPKHLTGCITKLLQGSPQQAQGRVQHCSSSYAGSAAREQQKETRSQGPWLLLPTLTAGEGICNRLLLVTLAKRNHHFQMSTRRTAAERTAEMPAARDYGSHSPGEQAQNQLLVSTPWSDSHALNTAAVFAVPAGRSPLASTCCSLRVPQESCQAAQGMTGTWVNGLKTTATFNKVTDKSHPASAPPDSCNSMAGCSRELPGFPGRKPPWLS